MGHTRLYKFSHLDLANSGSLPGRSEKRSWIFSFPHGICRASNLLRRLRLSLHSRALPWNSYLYGSGSSSVFLRWAYRNVRCPPISVSKLFIFNRLRWGFHAKFLSALDLAADSSQE